MTRRLTYTAIIIVVLIAGAQLIRPDRTNPTTDPGRSIRAHVGATSELIPVLNRSCGDCHSNQTVWPWYTDYAPMSWLMAYGVAEGRKAVNFSEWSSYSPARQQMLLAQSCQDASSGKMPGGIYIALRPEARLSSHDVEIVCNVSRQATATPAEASR